MSFFVNSVQGGKDGYLGNNMRLYYREDNSVRNNELNQVDFWSPRNPNGKYPRITSGSHSKVEPNLYEDRSFIRLQDVSLSYDLPQKLIGKLKAQAINIYVSGKNLITWTDWEGWDPETMVPVVRNNANTEIPNGLLLDGRPALRAFTFGIHITY
jgi:hypothetical protein